MEVAMDLLSSEYEFRIRWEPFMLRPQTPPDGLPMPDWYKDGNNPRIKHVRDVASSLGLDFNTKRERFACTLKGHALLEFAKEVDGGDKQDLVAEKLFKLCFTDADLLQEESLLKVAEDCGLDREKAEKYLRIKENLENTYYKALSWSEKGVTGVPTFYMNGQKVFSGAQDPEVFKKMFEISADKFPIQSPTSKS